MPQTTTPQQDTEEQLPFFVYGTLRTGQGNWVNCLKGKTAREVPAIAPDQVMYSDGLAFVTDREGYQVVGDLMFVKPQQYAAVLARLDQLEGYYADAPERSFYVRVAREVIYREGDEERRVRAWVYHVGRRTLSRLDDDLIVADGDWLNMPGRRIVYAR